MQEAEKDFPKIWDTEFNLQIISTLQLFVNSRKRTYLMKQGFKKSKKINKSLNGGHKRLKRYVMLKIFARNKRQQMEIVRLVTI